MMLKCGQKDNRNYTFGVRKDQIEKTADREEDKLCCSSCGVCLTSKMEYCPSCGEKL